MSSPFELVSFVTRAENRVEVLRALAVAVIVIAGAAWRSETPTGASSTSSPTS